jgi:hypothetical protein
MVGRVFGLQDASGFPSWPQSYSPTTHQALVAALGSEQLPDFAESLENLVEGRVAGLPEEKDDWSDARCSVKCESYWK